MAMVVTISDDVAAIAVALVQSGRFASPEEAVAAALHDFHDVDEELSADEQAAIAEGLADFDAGRVYSAEQIRQDLHERFASR